VTVLAWHLTDDTLGDGRPIPPVGEWLVHEGEIRICRRGLHASRLLIDALLYAPGLTLHRVECADVVEEQEDKLVCRRRRILSTYQIDREKVTKLAIECACLTDWFASLPPPSNDTAAAAWGAAYATASYTRYEACYWCARAARFACEAARDHRVKGTCGSMPASRAERRLIEARAVQLLTGGES